MDNSQDEEWRRQLCRLIFLTLERTPTETFIVPFPLTRRAILKELVGRVEAEDKVREALLQGGVQTEHVWEPDRPRLCWFIHTGRTLREIAGRVDRGFKNIGELLDMAEKDDRSIIGCGYVEAPTLNELKELLLRQRADKRPVTIRDFADQHASGELDAELPFLIFRIAQEPYVPRTSSRVPNSDAPARRSSQPPPVN